jgi:PBP1b-binding outer membrane lipoprotein LpoB
LALAIAAVLAAGCSDDSFYPATLEEVPPKEQAATPGQETNSPTPAESPTPTPTPTFEGLHVDCVFVDVSVPDTWELQEQADNVWAYSLPTKETGGGVVRISGSFEKADGAAAQKDLEARVRGEDGERVAVQVSGDCVVMRRLAEKKGN